MDKNTNSIVIRLVTGKDSKCNVNVFDRVIGQKSAISQLKFYASASSNMKPFPTILLQGSHGLGKTYLSERIAESLGRRFIEINSETIKDTKDFVENVVLNRIFDEDPVTLLVDEAHAMPKQIVNIMLTILAPNSTNKNILSYERYNFEWDMKKINVVFATNQHCKIPIALRNRCFPITLNPYSNDELIKIIQSYLPYDFLIDTDKDEIAYCCRGRARGAFMVAEDIKRVCSISGTRTFDDEGLNYLKQTIYRFPLGLNEKEVELLGIIGEESPISSKNIATKMMEEEETIMNDYEIRPRELGLMANTTKGRVLTNKGLEYLEKVLVVE